MAITKAGTPHYETAGAGIAAGQVIDIGGAVIFIQDVEHHRLDVPVEDQSVYVTGTLVLVGDVEHFVPDFAFLVFGYVEVVAHMPTSDWSADYARRAARENRRAKAEHVAWQQEYARTMLAALEAQGA